VRPVKTATVSLLIAMCLHAPKAAHAWDARAFEGEFQPVTASDLHPRVEHQDQKFYAEDYTLVLELQDGFKAEIKLGMTNLGEAKGSAFARCRWVGPEVSPEKVDMKLKKRSWSFRTDPFSLRMRQLTFGGSPEKMSLKVVGKESTMELTLKAAVPAWKPGNGKLILADQGEVEIILWPLLNVSGAILKHKAKEVVRFEGTAVLTHSLTTIPPQHQPPRWFYFRGSDARNPLFFQAVQLGEAFGGTIHGWVLWIKDAAIHAQSANLGISLVDVRSMDSGAQPWGLYFVDEIQGIEGAIQAEAWTRTVDPLKKLSKMEAAIVSRIVRPLSHFFRAAVEIRVKDKDPLRGDGTYKIEQMRSAGDAQ